MFEQKKFSPMPGVVGCIISFLLVVSFALPRIWENSLTVTTWNTVLIIMILCLSVHLVRITSSMFFDHVWKHPLFLVLLLIPISYLLIIAAQFIFGDILLFKTVVFNIYIVLVSLPMLCCYYFTALWFFGKRDRLLMICSSVLDGVGVLYCLSRLAEKVFLPLAFEHNQSLISVIGSLSKITPWFSLVIYILSFVNFIICSKLFSRVSEK